MSQIQCPNCFAFHTRLQEFDDKESERKSLNEARRTLDDWCDALCKFRTLVKDELNPNSWEPGSFKYAFFGQHKKDEETRARHTPEEIRIRMEIAKWETRIQSLETLVSESTTLGHRCHCLLCDYSWTVEDLSLSPVLLAADRQNSCFSCDGSGLKKDICPACEGAGEKNAPCPATGGSWMHKCARCNGLGMILGKCPECRPPIKAPNTAGADNLLDTNT